MRKKTRLRWFKRLYLELRAQRYFYFAPLVLLFLLVPLVNYAAYVRYSVYDDPNLVLTLVRRAIVQSAERFIAPAAVWWPVLVMKEYFDSQGNELLFTYRHGSDNLVFRVLLLYALYALHFIPHFIAYGLLLGDVSAFFLSVLVQGFFLICACYALAVFAKNSMLPLIASILYCLACYLFPQAPFNMFSINPWLYAPLEAADALRTCILASVGVFFLAAGTLRERSLYKNG